MSLIAIKIRMKVHFLRVDPFIWVELETELNDINGLLGYFGMFLTIIFHLLKGRGPFPIEQFIKDNPSRPDIDLAGEYPVVVLVIGVNFGREVCVCAHACRC